MAGQGASLSQAQQFQAAQQQASNARYQILGIQAKTVAFAAALWASYKIHNDLAMQSFLQRWVPTLEGAEAAIGQITQSYLNTAIRTLDSHSYTIEPVPSSLFTGAMIRSGDGNSAGIDPSQVYTRPFTQFYTDLSKNKPVDQALASAQARLKSMASVDLQLAHTRSARATFGQIPQGSRITGYRRVIGDDDPCELCVQAASQRYHSGSLMPIHVHCNCTVWPIVGTKDLGQHVNVVALSDNPPTADTTKFFGQTAQVHQHGEYGPVLTAGGQHFMTLEQAMNQGPVTIPG